MLLAFLGDSTTSTFRPGLLSLAGPADVAEQRVRARMREPPRLERRRAAPACTADDANDATHMAVAAATDRGASASTVEPRRGKGGGARVPPPAQRAAARRSAAAMADTDLGRARVR
eukprot:scaffold2334_cov357-Prasinococcus_capsulatus_cf.AAC.9